MHARFLLIAVTAAHIVVSIVALGGLAVLVRRRLDPRFGLTRLLPAGVLGFTVAGPSPTTR